MGEGLLHVLVVDDERAVARHLADGLRLLGHRTEVAHSAAEALALIDAAPKIGVVMTDVRMPGGDGLQLAQQLLRERRGLRAVEVILITGHAALDDAAAAARMGVSDLLRKPFRLADAAHAATVALRAAARARDEEARRLDNAARFGELERARDELSGRLEAAEALLRGSPDFAGTYRADLAGKVRAISHALRTPLTHIAGGTDLLAARGTGEPDPGLAFLREGLRDAVKAVELVEELQRAGQPPLGVPADEFDMGALVRTLSDEVRPDFAKNLVALHVIADNNMPMLRASAATVRRILECCQQVALHWSRPGGTVETVVRRIADDSSLHWCVTTLTCSHGERAPSPPDGVTLPASVSSLRETQEDLHFAIAKRLAMSVAGKVTSWSTGRQAMALVVALPC